MIAIKPGYTLHLSLYELLNVPSMKKQKTIYVLYDITYLNDPDSAEVYSLCHSLEEARKSKREMFSNAIIVEEVFEIGADDTRVISRNIIDSEISGTLILDYDNDDSNDAANNDDDDEDEDEN